MWGWVLKVAPAVVSVAKFIAGHTGTEGPPYAKFKDGNCKLCGLRHAYIHENGGCGVKNCPLERVEDPTP